MDFYKNKKRILATRYVVLVMSFLLLLGNCFNSYFDKSINYFGIISNILLIIAMIIAIKQQKKIDDKVIG